MRAEIIKYKSQKEQNSLVAQVKTKVGQISPD